MAPRDPQPTWQPISQLPTIAQAIIGMAGEAAGMLGSLRKAASKHRTLDDATVEQVIRLYTEQQDDLWLYEEQLRRWHARRLTIVQRQDVADLMRRLGSLRADLAEIFELATYLKPCAIDALLSPPDKGDPCIDAEALTPTMHALLQIAGCLESPEPIPYTLLLAPLKPNAAPGGPAALASLVLTGWLSAPAQATVQLTPTSRAFLATTPPDEPTRLVVAKAACLQVAALMGEGDVATLRLVAPHLLALADAWAPRGDRHALNLSLTAGMCMAVFGEAEATRASMARASALDAALAAP